MTPRALDGLLSVSPCLLCGVRVRLHSHVQTDLALVVLSGTVPCQGPNQGLPPAPAPWPSPLILMKGGHWEEMGNQNHRAAHSYRGQSPSACAGSFPGSLAPPRVWLSGHPVLPAGSDPAQGVRGRGKSSLLCYGFLGSPGGSGASVSPPAQTAILLGRPRFSGASSAFLLFS